MGVPPTRQWMCGGDSRRIIHHNSDRPPCVRTPNTASEIFLHSRRWVGAAGSSLIKKKPPRDACIPPCLVSGVRKQGDESVQRTKLGRKVERGLCRSGISARLILKWRRPLLPAPFLRAGRGDYQRRLGNLLSVYLVVDIRYLDPPSCSRLITYVVGVCLLVVYYRCRDVK